MMNYHILLVLLLASLLAPTCAVFQRRFRTVARPPKRFLVTPRDYHVTRRGPASPARFGIGGATTTVSPRQGDPQGEDLDAYIGDVISYLQKREELPADHPVWEGVRSDFIRFHARQASDEDQERASGKTIRSADDERMIEESVEEEIRKMAVDHHNSLSGITSDDVKALHEEEEDDYAGYHDCSIHFLEYDESVMIMKVFFHTPLCIEREEDRLRGAFPDAEVSRTGTENSVMLTFASRKNYEMAYQVYREEVRVNDGLEVDLTGISGWNPGGGTGRDGFSHLNVIDDSGQSYDEVVDFLELYDDRDKPDAPSREEEEEEEEERPLEESNFEDYVRRVVMKLQAREHIPVRDPIWQGVRRDFAEFLYGKDTDGYRRVAGRDVSYDGGEDGGPDEEEVKQEEDESPSSFYSSVNFVAQGVLGVCFVVLVGLVIKHQRERRPKKNVILPVSTADVPHVTSAPVGRRVLDPELHRIRVGIDAGAARDGCPRPESAPPRYIVVAPTEPRPPSHCYKLQIE